MFFVSLHAKFEVPEATINRQMRRLKTDTHSGKKMSLRPQSQLVCEYGISIAHSAWVIKKTHFSYNEIIKVLLEMA